MEILNVTLLQSYNVTKLLSSVFILKDVYFLGRTAILSKNLSIFPI